MVRPRTVLVSERLKALKKKVQKINMDDQTENDNVTSDKVVCIGVNGDSHSEYAIDFYLDNLHQNGNFLVLVGAFDVPTMHAFPAEVPSTQCPSPEDIYVSPITWDMMVEQETKRVEQLRRLFKQKIRDKNIPGKFVARSGKAGEVLVDVADEEGANMILVGTRDHGRLRRAILGSVSDYVTHNAHCSVMVCRQPARSRGSSESRSRSNSESYISKKTEDKRSRTSSENVDMSNES